MDKIPAAEKETLRTAIKAGQRHGLEIELIKEARQIRHPQADAVACVRHGEQETFYQVECKRKLRPATLGITLKSKGSESKGSASFKLKAMLTLSALSAKF